MSIEKSFGQALRAARTANHLSQEDFSDVSSRTYLSSLERGLKSPTLEKIQSLSERMGIHPLTLMTMTYLYEAGETDATRVIDQVKSEIENVLRNQPPL